MSRKQELALLYAKERRRVQSFYSRYRKKNYAIPENAIPARPKRITEGSIRRLQRMTPEFMKRKLVRYEKALKREERRQQREAIKTAYSYDESSFSNVSYEPANKFNIDEYQPDYEYTDYDWYDAARYERDATYLQQINDNEKRVDFAERYYDKQITDMSEAELKDIGYTKTPDGFIIRESTGEVVARDMSAEIQANNDFIDDITQLEDMPADALDAFKSEDEWREERKREIEESERQRKEGYKKGREIEKERVAGSGRSNMAQQIINNFTKDIRRFPRVAYPLLILVLNELLAEADANPSKGKEALADAIQKTIDEMGRITRDVAYNLEFLNDFADKLTERFHDNFEALKVVNDIVEESDNSW